MWMSNFMTSQCQAVGQPRSSFKVSTRDDIFRFLFVLF